MAGTVPQRRTARLTDQTVGGVAMSLLFTLTSADAAPRTGLAIGAVLALSGGIVSTLRIGKAAGDAPGVRSAPPPIVRPVG